MPDKAKKSDAKKSAAEDVSKDKKTVEKVEEIEEIEETSEVEVDEPKSEPASVTPAKDGGFKRFKHWVGSHKKVSIPLIILVIIGLVFAIPASRYPLLALGLKKNASVFVVDASTNKPVASATVTIDGQTGQTNNNGSVTLKVRVGQRTAKVTKKYYNDTSVQVFVNAFTYNSNIPTAHIKATGRQVPVSVVNKLTGKPVENATLKAAGTEIKTDKDGKATIVVPADQAKLSVEVGADKFNQLKSDLKVVEAVAPENTFKITPSGKVYFLSKKSGHIDVVKTELDGGNRQTVIAGTGTEEEGGTVLLASRDWHYLALLSRREGDKPKLYLIDTSSDKMTTMDEGDVNFTLIGWNDSSFVYRVDRNSVKLWQNNRVALKSYEAPTGKLNTIDQTIATGDQNTNISTDFTSPYLVDGHLVYETSWSANGYSTDGLKGKTITVRSVSVNGQGKKDLLSLPVANYYGFNNAVPYGPNEFYLPAYNQTSNKYDVYEYENGAVKASQTKTDEIFAKTYPTYLASPSGKQVLWSEQRDGVDTFFTGDSDAKNAKQIVALDDHKVYGWYSDDYVLLSKKDSELYIMPSDGGIVTKITDYHKPNVSYKGYGGGYGGL